jgi:ABC-type nitrate/sulfonate/bicarbonate transport system ATPase subunit
MTPPVVSVRDLTFDFGSPLLDRLSFDIPPGVSLVQGGESRGKSTLLRLLAGSLQPTSGQIHRRANPAHTTAGVYWHDPRSQDWDAISPRAFFAQVQEQLPTWNEAQLGAMVEHLQLTEHMDKAMYMLSTGSKRKVNWIAGLASGADLLLMDEPFAALDLSSIHKLHALLNDWHRHHNSAWVLADYQAPASVALAAVIDLGD